jgi:hypothetical protein
MARLRASIVLDPQANSSQGYAEAQGPSVGVAHQQRMFLDVDVAYAYVIHIYILYYMYII